jgi:hypothetical protein
MPGTHLLHATPHYATRRKCVQKFNKDLNALRTHLFHAIRQHATRRGTTYARSNRPDTRLFSKRVKACCPPSLLLQPRSRDFHTGSQVLPPDRKHPLLIDLKFSKNSGIIMYHCRTFCKHFKFFNETGQYFVLIQ